MTSYILTDDANNIVSYPYSIEMFRQDNPGVSLPIEPTVAQLHEVGIYEVSIAAKPEYDPTLQNCIAETAPTYFADGWTLGWDVVDKSAPEIQRELTLWRQNASCTPFQGRMALADAGLLAGVEAAVSAADDKTKVAWEYALEWKRMSPMIASLSGSLQMTDSQIDDLFKAAAEISA